MGLNLRMLRAEPIQFFCNEYLLRTMIKVQEESE